MKKTTRKILALLLTMMMVWSCTGALYAADEVTNVTAQLRPDFTLIIDGSQRTLYTAGGEQVYPVLYNGTTYLPLRAIGELMNRQVNWDQDTKTISLYGTRSGITTGTKGNQTSTRYINATLRGDFTLVIDGAVQTFKDASGNTIRPLLYDGTTYLPLRAIGQMMGKSVDWNGNTNTVTLGAGSSDLLVTDADSFGNTTSYIGTAKALEIALTDAGLKNSQVTMIRNQLEKNDSRYRYNVEFYTSSKEYDYKIDAVTGTIISVDNDADHYDRNQNTNGSYIGEDKAKKIALTDAGLKASQVTMIQCKLEKDDGHWQYDVEFYTGSQEYDYEIDAITGTILSIDYEADNRTSQQNGSYIGEDKAKEIALNKAGLTSSQVTFKPIKLDKDDGRWQYELEFYTANKEYECDIDAQTGNIIDWEMDNRHD